MARNFIGLTPGLLVEGNAIGGVSDHNLLTGRTAADCHTTSAITNFIEDVQDIVGSLVVGGNSVSTTYNDAGNVLSLSLVNDTDLPGNLKVYGTNASGVKGWQSTSVALSNITASNNTRIPFSNGTSLTDDSSLFWDNTNKLLNATNGVFSGTLALGNVTNSDGILIFANQTKAANIARYAANLQTTVDDTIALTGNITHFGTASRVYSGLSKAKLSTFTMTLYGTLSVGSISGNGVATAIYGAANQAVYSSTDTTHTVSSLVGSSSLAQNSSSGDIINAYGGYFQSHSVAGSGSQTITNSHGVYSTVTQATGIVTTGYLYRGAYSGTVGTKYGLHLAGCDINYLSGRLLIGSTSDNGTDALQITGSSNFTSDVTAGGALSFGSRLTQHINLYGTTNALGVQTNTTYIRTNGAFCLFRGGIHSNTQYAPGTGGTEVLRIDASNNLDLRAGDYYRAGVKLLGARSTGWVAATGTASRTTFATTSVTVAVLAQKVKALIDDLIAHGIIGA